MEKYFYIFGKTFQELLETLKADGVSTMADLFAADPLHNIQRESGRLGSDYDVFSKQNVEEMLQCFCEDVTNPGDVSTYFVSTSSWPLERYYLEIGRSWFWMVRLVFRQAEMESSVCSAAREPAIFTFVTRPMLCNNRKNPYITSIQ